MDIEYFLTTSKWQKEDKWNIGLMIKHYIHHHNIKNDYESYFYILNIKSNANKSKDFLKRTVKNLFSFETGLFDYLRKSF